MERLATCKLFSGAIAALIASTLPSASGAAVQTNHIAGGTASAQSWPMFRGNPGLTGISPAKLPNTLSLLWSYKTGGPVKSSAAIAHGKAFIGSDDKQVHCIDLKTGKAVWTFATQGEIESSPLVLDGLISKDSEKNGSIIYVGSSDGNLYALDAADGKLVWKFQTEDKILGGPNWVSAPDGKSKWVLAGSYDYRLYCFDALTGKTNWTYETGNYINGTPAVADGKTVFGGCDALLHVISLKDGQKIKEVDAGAYIAGSGAFEASRFYVGHYENDAKVRRSGTTPDQYPTRESAVARSPFALPHFLTRSLAVPITPPAAASPGPPASA